MKYQLLPEKQLIELAKNGDILAFECLFLENQDYIKKWIFSLCKGNDTMAEEIFQIASFKTWNKIGQFKGECKFKTWACSISRNLFIDMKRKSDKRSEICLEIDPDGDGVRKARKEASIEIDPLKKFKSQELQEFLFNVLEKLSPEHRNVLRYYALEQLSYEEIAKAMQCSIGTVMSRLFYARKKAQKVFYQTKKRKDYCDSY